MKFYKFWKKSSEKKNKEPTKKSAKKAVKASRRQVKKVTKAAKYRTKKQDPQQCECERCKVVQSERIDFERQIYLREKHEEDMRTENMRLQQELLSLTEGTSYSLDVFSEDQQLQNSRVSDLVQHFEQWMQQIMEANSSTSNNSITEQQTPQPPEAVRPQADSNPLVQPSSQLQILRPTAVRTQAPVPAAPTAPVSATAAAAHHGYIDPVYLYYYQRYYQYMGTDPDITTQQHMGTYPNTTGQHYTAPDHNVNTVQQLNVYTSQEYTGQQVETNPAAYEELLLGRSLMNELSGDSSTTTNEAPDTNANEQPDIGRSRLATCMNETMQHPQHQLRQVAKNEYGGAQHHNVTCTEQLPASVHQVAHVQNQEVYGITSVAYLSHAHTGDEVHHSYR